MLNCFQNASILLAVQSISFVPDLLLTEQNLTERITNYIVNMNKRPLGNMHERHKKEQ